jgi:hypothetical protein
MARLLFVFFVLWGSWVNVAAAMQWSKGMDPAALRGSFYETCEVCRVDQNGYLVCRCWTEGRSLPAETAVRLPYCSREPGPENFDGRLRCVPIVRGTWGQTCSSDSWVYFNTLLAYCQDLDGLNQVNRIDLDFCPHMKFENIDGALRCLP